MNDIELIDEIVKRAEEHQKQREKEFAIFELETIKKEIKDLDLEFFDEDYRAGVARGIAEFNKILNKHIAELKGENDESI